MCQKRVEACPDCQLRHVDLFKNVQDEHTVASMLKEHRLALIAKINAKMYLDDPIVKLLSAKVKRVLL